MPGSLPHGTGKGVTDATAQATQSRPDRAFREDEQTDPARQIETPGTCRTRVEEEDLSIAFYRRAMAVPEDADVRLLFVQPGLRVLRHPASFVQDVAHTDSDTGFRNDALSRPAAFVKFIHIAGDGDHRRDFS